SDNFLGQGMILILDEPESHLHPIAQKWLAKQMHSLAESGLQIIITTHSPYFINLEYLPAIYIVSKDEQTKISNITAEEFAQFSTDTGAVRATAETILPFYAAHSKTNILSGLFAKKIVLVEGETEELSLPIILEGVGLDVLKEGIANIGVGGKGNLAKWWRLFTALNIPTFICFDNDSSDDKQGLKRKESLKAIGIQDEAIEEVLTSQEWNINDNFCVFGQNYEATMRATFSNYVNIENEVKEELGNSKPIISRAVAKRLLEDNIVEEEWQKFKEIAQKIIKL